MMRPVFRRKETQKNAKDGALTRRFETRVRLSWLALLGERIWEALLWPFLVVAAFLVISLLELWSLLPPLLHRLLLGGFGLALIVSFLPLIRVSLPNRSEALRRLERTAGIKHRPASSYEDHLGTTPARETAALWAMHRERLSRLIGKLRPSWPAPRTDRKDPYAIRAALLLGVVPQAPLLRFLTAGQAAQVLIDLVDQLLRQPRRPMRMRPRHLRQRLIQQHRRTDANAAQAAIVAGVGFEDLERHRLACQINPNAFSTIARQKVVEITTIAVQEIRS